MAKSQAIEEFGEKWSEKTREGVINTHKNEINWIKLSKKKKTCQKETIAQHLKEITCHKEQSRLGRKKMIAQRIFPSYYYFALLSLAYVLAAVVRIFRSMCTIDAAIEYIPIKYTLSHAPIE